MADNELFGNSEQLESSSCGHKKDHVADPGKKVDGNMISKKKVRYKLTALVNEIEEIFANIRERNVDDSVCGLCEYDGAYIGQSGNWCNECPGFEKDNCFKLKDKYRAEWESIDE